MGKRTIYLLAVGASTVLALSVVLAASASHGPGKDRDRNDGPKGAQLISESAMLAGLGPGALFPFIDTTPNRITRAHIAVTDTTANCSAGASPPSRIQVLVGQAGVALTNVMTAATNTGIGSPAQCVFHVTVRAARDGLPSTITDIVVRNSSGAPLNGFNTVTASANVRHGR